MSVNGSDILAALNAGSGINANNLARQLTDAEKTPKEAAINRKIESVTSEISAYGELQSSLETLRASAATLKDQTDFSGTEVSTASTAMSFSVTDVADVGNYAIQVNSLAQRQQIASGGFDAATTSIGDGSDITLSVSYRGVDTDLAVSNPTPQAVVDAINASDTGLTARIINDGSDSAAFKIVVSGESGADNDFTLGSSSLDLDFSTTLTAATDASITIDGLTVTRATNEFEDVIPGVNMTVRSETAAAETVVFQRDLTGIESAITTFVDAFNATNATISALGSADSESAGALSGDGTLRFIENQLRGLILNGSSTPGEAISSLNDLGIQFNRQGDLEVDIETLRSQLTSNFDDVVTMFSANTSNQSEFGEAGRGLAGDLHRQLNDLMANDGIIQSRISSRETVVSRNESDLEDLNIQMEQVYERYLAQFIAMEQAVDNLNSLRDSLEVQFENLPFSNKRD